MRRDVLPHHAAGVRHRPEISPLGQRARHRVRLQAPRGPGRTRTPGRHRRPPARARGVRLGTGTITARGIFANANHEFLSGFFGRLQIPGRGPYRAALVPDRAIGANLAQQYVLVVGSDNTVDLRPVTPGTVFGNLRAVEAIGPGDRVIVNGLANARPGAKVRPLEIRLEWSGAATQAATQTTTQAATQSATAQPAEAPAAISPDTGQRPTGAETA